MYNPCVIVLIKLLTVLDQNYWTVKENLFKMENLETDYQKEQKLFHNILLAMRRKVIGYQCLLFWFFFNCMSRSR